jgi:hypothetical protein
MMKTQLIIGDIDFDLNRESLEAIARALPDKEKNAWIFEELASSPSARIRKAIASKKTSPKRL